MKRIRIALVLLAVVILLCVVTQQYQHRRIDRLLTELDRLEETYRRGDREQAAQIAHHFADLYSKVSNVMDCYIAYDDLAESQETAAILPSLLHRSGEEELFMELERLREQLRYLQRVDDPLLRNIL